MQSATVELSDEELEGAAGGATVKTVVIATIKFCGDLY